MALVYFALLLIVIPIFTVVWVKLVEVITLILFDIIENFSKRREQRKLSKEMLNAKYWRNPVRRRVK